MRQWDSVDSVVSIEEIIATVVLGVIALGGLAPVELPPLDGSFVSTVHGGRV